jgi:hypothetical protein
MLATGREIAYSPVEADDHTREGTLIRFSSWVTVSELI